MTVQMLALEHVHIEDDPGARRIGPGQEVDSAFAESIKRLGVLQSIVVRREADNRYIVRAGRRRVRAARAAGFSVIPAKVLEGHEDNPAIDAAENMARAPLAALDQWRAVGALIERTDCTVEQAADTLALTPRQATQMARFAALDPVLIEAMEKHGVPDSRTLRVIALAPREKQAKAAKARGRITKGGVDWGEIAYALTENRIPQSRAIFDLTKGTPAFIHDPFAEPGSPEEWTTTDAKGFIREQERALKVLVGRARENGEALFLADLDNFGRWKLPGGWQQTHDDPSKPVMRAEHPNGARFVAIDTRNPGWPSFGRVEYCIAVDAAALRRQEQEQARAERKLAKEQGERAPEDADDDAPGSSDRGPYTKHGLALIARARTEALRNALRRNDRPGPEFACGWALLALAADNIEVKGGERDELASLSTHIDDLVVKVLDPETPHTDYPRLLCDALARLLAFGSSEEPHGSGDAAEWIAHRVRADYDLGRFDTEEFLACVSKDEITRLAEANGIKPGKTAKATRALLIGNLPDYRPAAALFAGAPAPKACEEQDIGQDDPDDEEVA